MSLLLNDIYRFDMFELVLSSRSLSRNGAQLPISPKAFEVLTQLVIHSGRVVTKDEILKAVWPGSFVEEGNLSQQVSALRRALADRSGYIVTIPGRGYQFTARVSVASPEEASDQILALDSHYQGARGPSALMLDEPSSHEEVAEAQSQFPRSQSNRLWVLTSIALATLAIASIATLTYWLVAQRHRAETPSVSAYFQVTHDGREKHLAGTDGTRLYFTQKSPQLAAQIAVSGGVVAPVPVPIPKSWLGAVSPDGSTILVLSEAGGMTSAESMWSFGLLGSPFRHLADAVAATWSPDGESIAYSTQEGNVYLISADGSGGRKLVSMGGYVASLSWSPDASTLRFLKDGGLWEIKPDGTHLHPLLSRWHGSTVISEGRFAPDGSFYFVADGQIWVLDGLSAHQKADPVALTSGPVHWEGPTPSKDAGKIFAVGTTQRGELVRSDPKTGRFTPYLAGISAEFFSFSRNGKAVAYVTYPDGILWRANRDGSGALQLTSPPVYPKLLRWSPDGTQILFVDRTPQGLAGMYVVPSEGGALPRLLLPGDNETETDPSWSPDGLRIAFSTSPEQYLNPKPVVRFLDLLTHRVTTLPGSEGLYSPRWSPDGQYLVAATLNSLALRLYNFSNNRWTALQSGPVAFPEWSHDNRSIYYISWGDVPGVLRQDVSGGRPKRVADLEGEQYTGFYSVWMGLDPLDAPLMLRDRGSHDIYALTLKR